MGMERRCENDKKTGTLSKSPEYQKKGINETYASQVEKSVTRARRSGTRGRPEPEIRSKLCGRFGPLRVGWEQKR